MTFFLLIIVLIILLSVNITMFHIFYDFQDYHFYFIQFFRKKERLNTNSKTELLNKVEANNVKQRAWEVTRRHLK